MEPFATSSCTIGNKTIAYKESGQGDPVILIHGITTYSFIWRRFIPLLNKEYRVFAVDLPGCGASSKNIDEPYSIKNHARMIKAFLDIHNIDKAHIVGHDVGGGVAQIFAVHHPDMCHSVSLINSVAYDFWPVQPIKTMRTPIIRQLAMATLDKGALRLIVSRGIYHKGKLNRELLDLFWQPMKTKQGRKAFLHFASSLDNKNLLEIADRLHQLTLPFLIIRGDADPYLSGAISEKLAANIPHAKLVRIPTGSHFIQEDEPEQICSELISFFSGTTDE